MHCDAAAMMGHTRCFTAPHNVPLLLCAIHHELNCTRSKPLCSSSIHRTAILHPLIESCGDKAIRVLHTIYATLAFFSVACFSLYADGLPSKSLLVANATIAFRYGRRDVAACLRALSIWLGVKGRLNGEERPEIPGVEGRRKPDERGEASRPLPISGVRRPSMPELEES